jgi:hypothetical protein
MSIGAIGGIVASLAPASAASPSTASSPGETGGGSASTSTSTTTTSVDNGDGTVTTTVTNAQGVIQSVSTTGAPDDTGAVSGNGKSGQGSLLNLKV